MICFSWKLLHNVKLHLQQEIAIFQVKFLCACVYVSDCILQYYSSMMARKSIFHFELLRTRNILLIQAFFHTNLWFWKTTKHKARHHQCAEQSSKQQQQSIAEVKDCYLQTLQIVYKRNYASAGLSARYRAAYTACKTWSIASQPACLPARLPASSKPFLTERDRNLAARLPPTLKVTYRVNVKVINHSNELETQDLRLRPRNIQWCLKKNRTRN